MSDPTRALRLDRAQLAEIRDTLVARLREGLSEDGTQIRCLPAHLPPPAPDIEGDALVVDTGGTNMRAAVVHLKKDGTTLVRAGPVQRRLPMRTEAGARIDKDALFGLQADLAVELDAPKGLPVGYCFSYPSEVLPNRDARLIRWTKGIDVPGVEGERVGKALLDALTARGLAPHSVSVLNDTVASLLAGALAFDGRPRDVIGVIAGTGTNMAGFYDADNAPKLAHFATPMAVNFESGNYDPPHLSTADDAIDAGSINPGEQRFEKAVSGFYLPFLFAHLVPDADFDPHQGTGPIVKLQDEGSDGPARDVARALLARSADLVAAGLAAAATTYPQDARDFGILAEGALFWRATGYADRVQQTLRDLLPEDRAFRILHANDANLFGAACAALLP